MPLGRRSTENIFDEDTGAPLWQDTDSKTATSVRSNWPKNAKRKMKGWKKKPNGEWDVTYYIKK